MGPNIYFQVMKTDRFKAKNEDQHRDRGVAMGRHGCNCEDKAECQEHGQHVARLESGHHHEARAHETHERIKTLCHGEQVGYKSMSETT